MGYTYVSEQAPRPFTPGKIDFAKKKAKELQARIPDIKLAECQQAVAKALGWADWYALDQAVKRGTPASASDENTPEDEVRRRKYAQFIAFRSVLNIHFTDAEALAAELGLTCSAATAKKRVADVGPWGAFSEPPEEVAPGIVFGKCAKFHCYRLSPERQAAMHPLCRVESWDGWYMADDHDWRVVLSFPDEFPKKTVKQASVTAQENEPFIFELLSGKTPTAKSGPYVEPSTSIHELGLDAINHPDSWFALSCFQDWSFDEDATHELIAVSAVRGRHISMLLDSSRGADRGTWLDQPVHWFVLRSEEVLRGSFRLPLEVPAFRLSGLSGWAIDPVAKSAVKLQIFSTAEVEFIGCLDFEQLVDRLAVTGDPLRIE